MPAVKMIVSTEMKDASQNEGVTYHNTDEVQLTELVVSPSCSQLILLLSFRVQQDLNGIVSRRIRSIDATTKELQKW